MTHEHLFKRIAILMAKELNEGWIRDKNMFKDFDIPTRIEFKLKYQFFNIVSDFYIKSLFKTLVKDGVLNKCYEGTFSHKIRKGIENITLISTLRYEFLRGRTHDNTYDLLKKHFKSEIDLDIK